jgi:Protein of unknown function (DUF2397)
MTTPDIDAWELAGFPGRLDIAAYLTADQHAAQYRVLVDVLLDAQEHSLTGISRDELLASARDRITAATDPATAERLSRPDSFDIDARMKALQHWGVVIRWQDTAKMRRSAKTGTGATASSPGAPRRHRTARGCSARRRELLTGHAVSPAGVEAVQAGQVPREIGVVLQLLVGLRRIRQRAAAAHPLHRCQHLRVPRAAHITGLHQAEHLVLARRVQQDRAQERPLRADATTPHKHLI